MSAGGTWRAWLENAVSLFAGLVPGYVLAAAHWIGGYWLLFYAAVALIAYVLFTTLFDLPFYWITGRFTRRRNVRTKSAEKLKPALVLFVVGLAVGIVAFRAQLLWHQVETL